MQFEKSDLFFVYSVFNSDFHVFLELSFVKFSVGGAGNTPLVDAGTHLGAAKAVTPMSAGCLRWVCCILASL